MVQGNNGEIWPDDQTNRPGSHQGVRSKLKGWTPKNQGSKSQRSNTILAERWTPHTLYRGARQGKTGRQNRFCNLNAFFLLTGVGPWSNPLEKASVEVARPPKVDPSGPRLQGRSIVGSPTTQGWDPLGDHLQGRSGAGMSSVAPRKGRSLDVTLAICGFWVSPKKPTTAGQMPQPRDRQDAWIQVCPRFIIHPGRMEAVGRAK